MRVLVVNKFWYVRGGLERVLFDEIAMLESAGHAVAHFSTAHPENDPSPWSAEFAPYLELGSTDGISRGDRLVAVARLFRNGEAVRRFARVVERFEPDVVHCHGIHRQISPAIFEVTRARGIPVVQTLHDYHHVCPADVLLRGRTTPCEPRSCGTYWYGAAVSNRCVRGSLATSALSAAETAYQRFAHSYERGVSCFICPSEFMRDVMEAGGWRVPMRVVRNSVRVSTESAGPVGEYFLFAGRLSSEKGLDVLLDAARDAGVRLLVAGEGPDEARLRELGPSAEFLGRVSSDRVRELLLGCRAAVVPSVAFENAPLSVLEPMAAGVPLIASRIGGIPELARDGRECLLVEPGDRDALRAALVRLAEDGELAARLGAAGMLRARTEFSPERHLAELESVYTDVTTKGSRT